MKKTALITGASSGIGLELAKLFAKDGHNVVLVARSESKLQALALDLRTRYGVEALVLPLDLSDVKQVDSLYPTLQTKGIHIHFLVNNAGFGDYALFHEADAAKTQQMLDVNIQALTRLSQQFVKPMVENKFGRIMNVASTAAFQPGPLMAVYYASKAYVLSLSEAMHNELEGTGVSVTALCPGPTESGFQDAADMNSSKLLKRIPMASASSVAQYGYRALLAGKMTAIPGLLNNIGVQALRITPRAWAVKLIRSIQDRT